VASDFTSDATTAKPLRGGGYFMLGGPDGVVIEVFEPGKLREPVVRDYYGFGG
jgi:hypothetical protein